MNFMVFSILGLVASSSFFYLIFLKIKMIKIRRDLQKKGRLNEKLNITIIGFLELIFWMLPVFVGLKVKDTNHTGHLIKINLVWMIMVVSSITVMYCL